MKRDDDFLRALLLECEASDNWRVVDARTMAQSPEREKRSYHIMLLEDAGMMTQVGDGVYRLTNYGHDFLEMTRKNEAWEATKAGAQRLGGASLRMLYGIAEGYARQKLEELGIPLA